MTNNRISDDELRTLGFDPQDWTEAEALSLAPEGLGEGLSAAPAGDLPALLESGEGAFHAVPSRKLELLGGRLGRLDTRPGLLRVQSAESEAPRVFGGEADSRRSLTDDESGTLFLDLSGRSQPVGLRLPGGLEAALKWDGRDLLIRIREPGRASPEPPALPEPPLEEWLAGESDAWLAQEIEQQSDAGAWGQAVAAGLVHRFRSHRLGRFDAELLGGGELSALAPVRAWSGTLDERRLRALERLLLAEVDWLHRELAALSESLSPDDEEWQDDLLGFLRRRDDLQCAFVLLEGARMAGVRLAGDEAPDGAALRALQALDAEGRCLVRALPTGLPLADERLARALDATPDAWWVQPLAEASS